MNFPKDFPSVQTELLPVNYRSTGKIVEAAGKVIAWNKRRFQKKIHTDNERGHLLLSRLFKMEKKRNYI